MRSLLAVLLAGAVASAHAGPELLHQVDLDTPGALERVQRDHPAHFHPMLRTTPSALEMLPEPHAADPDTADAQESTASA